MDFNFADDLFEDNECENCGNDVKAVYIPKQCTEQWYLSSKISDRTNPEEVQSITFSANLLYYHGEYEAALKKYEERVQILCGIKNAPMLREITESCIDCYMKLGRYEEAEKRLTHLMCGYNNPADSSMYRLACDVFLANGKLNDAVQQLLKAIDINPSYPSYWLKLFHTLKILYDEHETYLLVDNRKVSLNENLLYHVLLKAKTLLTDSLRGRKDSDINFKCQSMLKEAEDCLSSLAEVSKEEKHMFEKRFGNGYTSSIAMNPNVTSENSEIRNVASFFKRWIHSEKDEE